MRILIAAPRRPGIDSGNEVTAARWQRRLTEVGHRVTIEEFDEGDSLPEDLGIAADIVVALHARRTAAVIASAKAQRPERPVVVALTGTDLYRDLPAHPAARRSIEVADACIVLQEAAVGRLDEMVPGLGARTHVVHQSIEGDLPVADSSGEAFVVVVLAHLRDVKDPLLAARAVRLLPDDSQVQVLHAGAAHTDEWNETAQRESDANDRYVWLGALDRSDALELLAKSSVLATTSLMEGGANVVTEAIGIGVPVIGTRVDGLTGLMGDDHPGLFPVGDAQALADLLHGLEGDPKAVETLRQRSLDRQPLTEVARERQAWATLIESLSTEPA